MRKIMTDNKPSVTDTAALWELCVKFIEHNNIKCPESVSQTDRVIQNAYDLIEDICNIVGYVYIEEDDYES